MLQTPEPPKPALCYTISGAKGSQASFDIPEDGGYTFTLLTSQTAAFAIDGRNWAVSPRPQPQVCGAIGNAVQEIRQSVILQKGGHNLSILRDGSQNAAFVDSTSTSQPVVLWEGPGIPRQVLK